MNAAGSRDNGLRNQLVGLIPHLRRFARSLAKDSYRADDLVQEACERVLRRRSRSDENVRLKSLLYRIIYNRWIDDLRRDELDVCVARVRPDVEELPSVSIETLRKDSRRQYRRHVGRGTVSAGRSPSEYHLRHVLLPKPPRAGEV